MSGRAGGGWRDRRDGGGLSDPAEEGFAFSLDCIFSSTFPTEDLIQSHRNDSGPRRGGAKHGKSGILEQVTPAGVNGRYGR